VGSVLDNLPRESRVALLRLRSLGDCVLTTPAVEILKRARPDLRVAVVVEERFRAVFEGNPDVEAILPPRLGALREWRPRLCLNLHGGTRSAWMTALSGALYRAGFGHFRHRGAYNIRIPRAQEILGVARKVHTAEHLASAMFYLGAERREIPQARLEADRPVRTASAVIHPVAATPEKTWLAAGFLEVAHYLQRSGLEPVFIGGPGDDLSPFREFLVLHGAPLGEIKNLLAGASLFVGNDSGPAHMAAAFGLPVVIIFGPSDPQIWAPWRTASEVIAGPGGIAEVAPARVIEALSRLRVPA
jgi:heptosyltransferase III